LKDRGEFSAGRTLLRAAADRYPHDVWLLHNLYLNCSTSEPPNWPEALRHVSAASVQWPDCGLFHVCIGNCYAKMGSYDEAIAAYRKAMSLYVNPGGVYYNIGVTLSYKNDLDGAIAALRESVRLLPTNAAVQTRLELVLKQKESGDKAKARTVSDLDRLQGKWERLWATEPGPYGDSRRAIKDVNRDTETVTFFDAEGKVTRSHRVTIRLDQTGRVRTFSYSDMEVLDGPDKGQKSAGMGSYVYVLNGDALYELSNVLIEDSGQPPSVGFWKRMRP
jgi:tetratricopeptide (TPR) repeat protein